VCVCVCVCVCVRVWVWVCMRANQCLDTICVCTCACVCACLCMSTRKFVDFFLCASYLSAHKNTYTCPETHTTIRNAKGARISLICTQSYSRICMQIHTSLQIHTTIRNTKGARTSLYGSVPQDAFEMLVKRLVKQLREPASWYAHCPCTHIHLSACIHTHT
jgi:hypothetical protein